MKIQEINQVKLNNKNRRALQIIAALFLLLCIANPRMVHAQQAPYVHDDAELMTGAEVIGISNEIKDLMKKTGWEVMAFSTDDTRGETSKGYGETAFGRYAAGEDGIAVIIDMDHGEVALVTFGEAADYLSDERLSKILDDSYSYAGEEKYADAFETMIEGIDTYYDEGKTASPDKTVDKARMLSIAAFFIVVIMTFIFIVIRKRILRK